MVDRMRSDLRRDRRKWMTTTAVLAGVDGTIISAARTLDVSTSGMKVSLAKAVAVRGPVLVILSRDGSVRRKGTVIWQRGRQAGIKFDRRYEAPTTPVREPAAQRWLVD